MTPARYDQLLRDLTQICRKVFDATPITETWHDAAIMAELRRKGSNVEGSIIRGCLENLRRIGLVDERTPRNFQRIAEPVYKPKVVTMPMSTGSPELTATTHRAASNAIGVPVPRKLSAVERLGGLAADLRSMADELDEIAIQVDDEVKGASQGAAKLKQLRDLLAGV